MRGKWKRISHVEDLERISWGTGPAQAVNLVYLDALVSGLEGEVVDDGVSTAGACVTFFVDRSRAGAAFP